MPATETTLTVIGDLKESTKFLRTHAVISFSVPVTVTKQSTFKTVMAVDDTAAVPMTAVGTAKLVIITLDDQLDGTVEYALNGSTDFVAIDQNPGILILAGTSITSIDLKNTSGNEAGVRVDLAA